MHGLRSRVGNGNADVDRVYIAHIDGLRFVAVSLVLLYHAGVPGFSGGFIGVDIFFVISGFLITRIVTTLTMDRGGILGFYASRVRRIVPAYLLVVAATGVFACFVLLPIHLEMLMPGLISCLGFLSNIVFYRSTSYFSPDLAYNPLLHTWSLAVEWQFYLLYPFIFIVCRRLKLRDGATLALMAATSFALCVVLLAATKLEAAFYLLPTRMWEFALGGMTTLLPARTLPPALSRLLTGAAVIALAVCAVHYDRTTLFPGLAALPPCLASAILIREGGRPGLVQGFLTQPAIRLLGQASYSIYLWHWPIIVFLDYGFVHYGAYPAVTRFASILLLSLAAGLASWCFVESPFRRRDSLRGKRVAGLSALATVPLLTAIVIVATGGLPQRYPSAVAQIAAGFKDVGAYRSCLTHIAPADGSARGLCALGAPDVRPSFLLLGDSHAAALAEGLSQAAAQLGKAGVLSVADACPPFLDYPSSYLPARRGCARAQQAMPALLARMKPDTVILHATWPAYYQADPVAFKLQLVKTLDWFATQKVRVYLIGDTPGASANVPIGLAKKIAYHDPFQLVRTSDYQKAHAAVDALLRTEADARGFIYLDTAPTLCAPGGYCEVEVDNHTLYWDAAHLSGYGSRLVAADLVRSRAFMF